MAVVNQEHICPISLCPIKDFGMTCYGSVYEYSVIKEWLIKNNTDPITNRILLTKFIVKLSPYDISNLEARKKDMLNSTRLWCTSFMLFNEAPEQYEKLLQIKKYIESFTGNELKVWNEYVKEKSKLILKNNLFRLTKDYDGLIRPENTGYDFMFLDLSNNLVLADKNYKSNNFSFCNLENITFLKCSLPRCVFIGTKLSGTKFIDCTFIGEEICFYRAEIKENNKAGFFGCKFEYAEKWVDTMDVEEIKNILISRKMDITNVVVEALNV